MGFLKKLFGASEGSEPAQTKQPRISPSDYVGTRYRSDVAMSDAVGLWDQAVRQAYRGAGAQRSVAWSVSPFPSGYDPYDGERGIGGGLIPARAPEWVIAIDVAAPPGTVYLATWPEMVSLDMTRPIVELWCVTPDDTYNGLERQRLERFWNDDTLSRLGFVQRGLWGVDASS